MNYRTLAYTCGHCGKGEQGIPNYWYFGDGYLCSKGYNTINQGNNKTITEE